VGVGVTVFKNLALVFRVIRVTAHVDHHGARQNQDVVLTVGDVNTVAVGPGDVLLRNARDRAAMPSKAIFIIE
jgi:hypothetical protein